MQLSNLKCLNLDLNHTGLGQNEENLHYLQECFYKLSSLERLSLYLEDNNLGFIE